MFRNINYISLLRECAARLLLVFSCGTFILKVKRSPCTWLVATPFMRRLGQFSITSAPASFANQYNGVLSSYNRLSFEISIKCRGETVKTV